MADSVDDAAAAFGDHPTLKARGAYLKEYGQKAYDEEMLKWGADPFTLKPGKSPYSNGGSNPSKNPWAFDDEKSLARRLAVIRGLGTAKAAELAKAAGRRIDGTPLPT